MSSHGGGCGCSFSFLVPPLPKTLLLGGQVPLEGVGCVGGLFPGPPGRGWVLWSRSLAPVQARLCQLGVAGASQGGSGRWARGSCPSPRAREEGRERDAVSTGLQVGMNLAQNGNSASLVFPLLQGSELSTCLEKEPGAEQLQRP